MYIVACSMQRILTVHGWIMDASAHSFFGSHKTNYLIKSINPTIKIKSSSATQTKVDHKGGREINSAQSLEGRMVAITEAMLPC